METSTPTVDVRADQPYLGINARVTMTQLDQVIPSLIGETAEWLGRHGIVSSGPPLVRYRVIDMPGTLDIDVAWPVPQPAEGDERVRPGTLPAGRYASLVYVGIDNGVAGNGALLDWIDAQGLRVDSHDTPEGDAFAGRYESFLTDPDEVVDRSLWETEVAMLLADEA